ncbi:class I SAM-dependent methyltransferase [Aquiflexum lacus]|uniref:class I SAM-dependent methyltransferase n=1 Tax=Aquiflexum lacus TaxID=2483805 RepID=UPI001894767F|nr:class I SAM-dependent methyltransferase [Aquiflexum lacus]
MNHTNSKPYWENIYSTKDTKKVGWFQPRPALTLSLMEELAIPKDSQIIDIGGGDSHLVDFLLADDYRNVTVLDISTKAIEKAKLRLAEKSKLPDWIVSDIREFEPHRQYDLWHDRAAFHFLTEEADISNYVETAKNGINENGLMIIGTFSDKGPDTCSGLPVMQYALEELQQTFSPYFETVRSFNIDHITPSGLSQNYSFCVFRKK